MNNEQPEIRPRRFLTTELSNEEAERIAASRMDKHHDHLSTLLDEKKGASATPSPGNLSGDTLTAAMQASLHRGIEIEPQRTKMPVREVS